MKKRAPNKNKADERLGETKLIRGEKATIIRYGGALDIDVEFEDGTVVRHRQYDAFNRATLTKGNRPIKRSLETSRVGEESVIKGEKARIIAYRNCLDIDVEFEDGTVYKNTTYKRFTQGNMLKHKRKYGGAFTWHIGEERRIKGHRIRIVDYRTIYSIDCIIDDLYPLNDQRYDYFIEGRISIEKINEVIRSGKTIK
jgi:hypothetical protein